MENKRILRIPKRIHLNLEIQKFDIRLQEVKVG